MGTPVENKTAIIFEADDGEVTKVTYKELLAKVCQFANALKAQGIKKGDRVIIYMPMTIEGVVAMQACARIGATHSVVFGGFSAKALQERIIDAGAVAVITANYQMRGGKELPLKAIVDEGIAMGGCESIKNVMVFQRTATACNMVAGRDRPSCTRCWRASPPTASPRSVGAEHPLFILYTSGSTGKPKGVQHCTGGYLLWAKLTMDWTFDLKADDVFWCTADIGWITGHTYVAYGPLAAGATQIVFEGVPTYPNAGRFWQMIENHKCTIFYTAPTAIRSLIKAAEGDEKVHPARSDLSSLRILGSVGEPINPEAWMWYYKHVGGERCPIVDTFWQTETGGHMITPLPGATPLVPGSCTLPLPGITAAIVDESGQRRAQRRGRHPGGQEALAVDDPHHLGRPRALQEELLPRRTQGLLPGRRRRGAQRRPRLLPHHRPHRRRAQRVGPPHGHDGNRIGAGVQDRPGGRSRRGGPSGRPDRRGHLRLRGAQASAPDRRRSQGRSPRNCATGWARRSARSPSPRTSASATTCPRPAPARSCAACCAPSPRARPSPRTPRTLENPAILDQLGQAY